MKNKINGKTLTASVVFFCLSILMTMPALALTITDQDLGTAGLQFTSNLNDGALLTDSSADPNTFAKELWAFKDDSATLESNLDMKPVNTLTLNDIPYVQIGSSYYFLFVYDAQETGGNSPNDPLGGRPINIDDIVISAGGIEIWNYNNAAPAAGFGAIQLNYAVADFSSSPTGDGGDLALYVPLSLFYGKSLTGGSELIFSARQSNSDNGKDEWVAIGGLSNFDPEDPIIPPQAVVPEPSTVVLLGSGLLGLLYVGRSRRRR